MNDLEHPDITAALLTGYPRGHRDTHMWCEHCRCEIDDFDDCFEDDDHDFLCLDCLKQLHRRFR